MTPAQITAAAIKRAGDHADPEWATAAMRAVVRLARTGKPFSTDDVWAALAKSNVTTHEHRALGSIMRTANNLGIICRNGNYTKTARPEAHQRPIAMWVKA